MSNLSDHILGSFQGIATIQGFNAEPRFEAREAALDHKLFQTRFTAAALSSLAFAYTVVVAGWRIATLEAGLDRATITQLLKTLAVAVPPLTVSAETLAESQKRERDLEKQNAVLKSENERLKEEMEALKQENAGLRQGNAGTKLLHSADALIENNPLSAEGSPPSQRKERSADSAVVESPQGRSPKRQRTPLRSVHANTAPGQ